jgi:hypothetical protein
VKRRRRVLNTPAPFTFRTDPCHETLVFRNAVLIRQGAELRLINKVD